MSVTRVVITGVGVVTSLGNGRDDFWEGLLAGRSGITPVTSFDTSEYGVDQGGEVQEFDPGAHCRRLEPDQMGRSAQLAIAAAHHAVGDARLTHELVASPRTAVSIGTTAGEGLFVERYNDARRTEAEFPAEQLSQYLCSTIADNVADELGAAGPCTVFPNACAAGNHAVGDGFDLIRANRAERVLTGGAESFSRIMYAGFARLGAVATDRCRPFDLDRGGMIPGEGAAVLVLESLELAVARGAPILAEILGYGLSCDAHHMTAAHPQGAGAIAAMRRALEESGVATSEVDYVSAHGTGTPTNDRSEALAMAGAFGAAARVPISSIKSMIGHTMGAASAIEAVACALALDSGVVPPTINFTTPDPDCPVDCVPNEARRIDPRVILSNAFAFGGNNATLCMKRFEP